MDKYVGEAERNIRDVFKDAEMEWAKSGEQVSMSSSQSDHCSLSFKKVVLTSTTIAKYLNKSALHVLIFDEIDSIARRRGSLDGDGSGRHQ